MYLSMSNTSQRIVSGSILIAITALCIYAGQVFVWGWTAVLGILMLDEVLCNFFKRMRKSFPCLLAQGLNLILCLSFPFWQADRFLLSLVVVIAALINSFSIIHLFWKIDLLSPFKKNPALTTVLLIFPLLALGSLIYRENWMIYLSMLLLITIGMDSGAWFFGKLFGRRKLCPGISPNKTLEGLAGGCLVAGAVSGFFWFVFVGNITFLHFILLAFFGFLSQVGDLVQSKFKREYNIKDSSGLIPGHGGIYDRLDSVIFLAPFFSLSIGYF